MKNPFPLADNGQQHVARTHHGMSASRHSSCECVSGRADALRVIEAEEARNG